MEATLGLVLPLPLRPLVAVAIRPLRTGAPWLTPLVKFDTPVAKVVWERLTTTAKAVVVLPVALQATGHLDRMVQRPRVVTVDQ